MSLDSFEKKRSQQPEEVLDTASESVRAWVRKLYTQHGHPEPDARTLAAINGVAPGRIQSLCHAIESARRDGYGPWLPIETIVRYGLTNLSGIAFHDLIGPGVEARNVNFREAKLEKADFDTNDLSYSDLTDTHLDGTNFRGSNLDTAIMPSIMLKGERINLEEDAIVVQNSRLWNVSKTTLDTLGTCSDCEWYNGAILPTPERFVPHARRAVLLFQEGNALGMLKLKGLRTFLAFRTVRDPEQQAILRRGMLYALEPDVQEWFDATSRPYKDSDSWRRVDLEKMAEHKTSHGRPLMGLGRNNLRFLREPELYVRMHELLERIEHGEEPMEDILTAH